MKIRQDQSGVVILLTLIIMFILSTIGLIIAVVVLNKIKITRNDVWSGQAYYAADSGLEKGLYKIRTARENGTSLAETLSILRMYDQGEVAFVNGSEFGLLGQIAPELEDLETRKILPQKSAEFHFFDPDLPTAAMGIEYFLPVWTDSCDGLSTLEFSIYEVSAVLAGSGGDETIFKNIIDCGGLVGQDNLCLASQGEAGATALLAAPTATESYIVRATSIKKDPAVLADCEVSLRLLAYGGTTGPNGMTVDLDNQIAMPTNILLTALGKSNTSEIELRAYVPWKYEISGLADFVLFSNEALTK